MISHCNNVEKAHENLKCGENINHSQLRKTLCLLTIYSYPPACLKFNKFFVSLDLITFLGIADEIVHNYVQNILVELPRYISEG
jgi:hypothetical protein